MASMPPNCTHKQLEGPLHCWGCPASGNAIVGGSPKQKRSNYEIRRSVTRPKVIPAYYSRIGTKEHDCSHTRTPTPIHTRSPAHAQRTGAELTSERERKRSQSEREHNGTHFFGASRRREALQLRPMPHEPDQPQPADQHTLHGRHRTCLFVQARGQPDLQQHPGAGNAHRPPHGARCHVQELRRQAGLDVRVRHRGVAEVQGRPRDSRIRPGHRG